MRAIVTAIIVLSVSTIVVGAANGAARAPVGHRQPTPADVAGVGPAPTDKTAVDKDNELLGADQVHSEEDGSAKRIEQENDRLDRLIRGICRGC